MNLVENQTKWRLSHTQCKDQHKVHRSIDSIDLILDFKRKKRFPLSTVDSCVSDVDNSLLTILY